MLLFLTVTAHAAEPCGPGGCPAPPPSFHEDREATTALPVPPAYLRTATFALG